MPVDSAAAEILMLAANDIEDGSEDLVDADKLLDPEDLKKPDPASRKALSGGQREKKKKEKKRKACKNCICGLAGELERVTSKAQSVRLSTRGNCYLGGAFDLANCPYLSDASLQAWRTGAPEQ